MKLAVHLFFPLSTTQGSVSGTAKPEAIVQPRLCVKSVHLNWRSGGEFAQIEKRQLLRMPLLEQLPWERQAPGSLSGTGACQECRGTFAVSGCQQITSEGGGLYFPSSLASLTQGALASPVDFQ